MKSIRFCTLGFSTSCKLALDILLINSILVSFQTVSAILLDIYARIFLPTNTNIKSRRERER